MSVWLTIPSARPPEEANKCLSAWRERGYKIALFCDPGKPWPITPDYISKDAGEYPGYAKSINDLIAGLIHWHGDAKWFVIGGDDVWPDPNKSAEEIAAECWQHFFGCNMAQPQYQGWREVGTFGVMQPTGDRYADGQIDRICGSAWIGREFAQRVNQGNGPLWPEYTHMFVDEELQHVALKYGVLWQRPDLTQLHMQFCRESAAIDSPGKNTPWPAHITHDGYTPQHWAKLEALFKKRRAEGFPGSELR